MSDLFLRACRREPVERVPVWLMRQAGRYLPGYQALRARHDLVTLFRSPDLAVAISLEPVERFGVDAAILFSDILMPVEAMGFRLAFEPGPRIEPAVRSRADVERVPVPEAEEAIPAALETVRLLKTELKGQVPLIGFGAAPFTLAAYLVEGGPASGFESLKRLLYENPRAAHGLLEKTAGTIERCLRAEIAAGAEAVQVFDTWAGILSVRDYRDFALPYARRVLDALAPTGVPRIYFALGASHLLEAMAETGAEVLSLDWRLSLAEASRRLGPRIAVQGNLDPVVLLAGPEAIEREALRVIEDGAGAPGHVFNLGHGVLPATPVASVETLVGVVHGAPARARRS